MRLGEVGDIGPLMTKAEDTEVKVISSYSRHNLGLHRRSADGITETQSNSVESIWGGFIVSEIDFESQGVVAY